MPIWSRLCSEQGPGVSVEVNSVPSDLQQRKPDYQTCGAGVVEPSTIFSFFLLTHLLWPKKAYISSTHFYSSNSQQQKRGLTLTAMLRSIMLTLVLRCQQTCISVFVRCWICRSTLSASESSDISDEPQTKHTGHKYRPPDARVVTATWFKQINEYSTLPWLLDSITSDFCA